MSSTWHPSVCRPKITDEWEREMANDMAYLLGRDEPSMWWSFLQWIGQVVDRTATAFMRSWRSKPAIDAP